MTKNEILERLTPIAQTVFMKPDLVLVDELDSTHVDTWNSLSFMQFIAEIENEFNFKFKMMEILRLQNIEAIVVSIEKHTA